jgi:hypothetical protein
MVVRQIRRQPGMVETQAAFGTNVQSRLLLTPANGAVGTRFVARMDTPSGVFTNNCWRSFASQGRRRSKRFRDDH